ncbi:EAL domain-containing protein [Pseudoxanthomonas sp. Soil82]|uniref:putative bifunctional diguanylate cyclase/phosphodiesterase n=1 Tax=Pseudoxanthomonas sp. Soil82 TaxID=3157341 RepID=UPI0033906394
MQLPPWIEGTFLRSRLGRRIFLTFCVAVVVPAAAVSWLAWRTASADALETSQAALRTEIKHYALNLFERLESAHALLRQVGANDRTTVADEALLKPFFSKVETVPLPLGGTAGDAGLGGRLARHAGDQALSTALVVLPARQDGEEAQVVILVPNRGERGDGLLAGVVRPGFLWGESDDQVFDGQLCVLAGDRVLRCHGDLPEAAQSTTAIRDEWELFLEPAFGAGSWRVTAVAERAPVLASYLGFLAPLALGLLLLVLMLSSMEIRRILVPLERLVGRIRAVGQGATTQADTRMDDEFETLARTFDDMEGRIRRQMDTLRILSEIDRLILERVPAAAVVDVVIARIHEISRVDGIGVSLAGVDPQQPKRHFLRMRGQRQVEAGSALPDTLHEAAYALEPGQWTPMREVGEGFAARGVQEVLVLAVGHREQSRAWIALACGDGGTPGEEVLLEVRDLAERVAVALAVEEHENLLLFQARHDPLTGLANRLAALEALDLAIEGAKASGETFATVFIDLDRFKSINDGLGHAQGDTVLVRAGELIRQGIGPDSFLARFGGDEFFVILRNVQSPADAARITSGLAASFATPLVSNGTELVVGFSAGVALYPEHGSQAHELIHNSDVAMYRAKKAGGGRMAFFDEEMNAAALNRVQLENDLRTAIRAGLLEVHYQPRVDSRSGRIVGTEALARWTHPVRGRIAPDTFIGVAEECGLIEELGELVLRKACHQMAAWKSRGLDPGLMAINVSSYQLRSGHLADTVGRAVAASGIQWRDLEIEVTESLLVSGSGAALQQLQALREAGATVAIDDFGTGYSSLAYLTRLPVDTLKIDRAFMADLADDGASLAVVRSIIALASALDKNIVAEGVESAARVQLLRGLGCHIVQGYVYYPPLDPGACAEVLQRLATQDARVANTR